MGTVGAQVIVERLIVAYIDENLLKDSDYTIKMQGNRYTSLDTILQQSHCFQAN